jgi:hypothetical protein
MTKSTNLHLDLANVLRSTGRSQCLAKADALEFSWRYSGSLALRGLGLTPEELGDIIAILAKIPTQGHPPLTSLSFSNNDLLGDSGVLALVQFIPESLLEIGLVNCGFGDVGGQALLNWALNTKDLKMICIEGNNLLSEDQKKGFDGLRATHPNCMIVV